MKNGKILFILPVEHSLSIDQIKVLGSLLKDLLIIAKTTFYDVSYSTQHYYDIMKKCQILAK